MHVPLPGAPLHSWAGIHHPSGPQKAEQDPPYVTLGGGATLSPLGPIP